MKVGTKIGLGFASLILLIIILGSYSFYSLQSIKARAINIEKSNKQVILAMKVEEQLKNAVASVRGYVAYGDEKFYQQLEQSLEDTIKTEQQLLQIVDEKDRNEIQQLIKDTTSYGDGLTKELAVAAREMHREETLGNIDKARELKRQTLDIAGKLIPYTEKILKISQNIVSKNESNMTESLVYSRTNADRINSVSLVINVLAIIAGILLSFFLTQIIHQPITQMVSGANKYTEGDFRNEINVRSRNELGELATALNKMQATFKEILQKIQSAAFQLNDASSELSVQSQQTSEGASNTASTMMEIASTVQNMAENAQVVSRMAYVASENADAGQHGIEKVTNQMQEIASATGQVNNSINALNLAIDKIGQFVEVITHIADQTNLLALNAAIEAARAGEAGKGFSVVADEVRKLAEQSAQSTREIKQLIVDINNQASQSLQAMSVSSEKVSQGNQVVREVSNNFNEIIKVVQELSEQVQSVAAAAQQVSAGVQNVAATTEEQTAAMEEVSAAAEALTTLSDDLRNFVVRFKL